MSALVVGIDLLTAGTSVALAAAASDATTAVALGGGATGIVVDGDAIVPDVQVLAAVWAAKADGGTSPVRVLATMPGRMTYALRRRSSHGR